jgi:acyl-CoA synthetase (AMP-forming)/AMP-acid ligase II
MATEHTQISQWRNELLPNVVDHLAKVSPLAPYALYPNSPTTYDDGYRTVTYKDFANAINGFAWWLKETLGPAKNFDILAYFGPNDVRYTALCLGAVKAGYVVCESLRKVCFPQSEINLFLRPSSLLHGTASSLTMLCLRSWIATHC